MKSEHLTKKGERKMKSEHLTIKQCLISLLVCCVILIGGLTAEAKDTIRIGVAGPMNFSWGKNMLAGVQVAAEEINAAGGVSVGVKKMKIEVVSRDSNDYLSVLDAVNAIKKLITIDKVDFLDFGARSEAIIAQFEVMADYKIVSMCGGGGSPRLHKPLAENYDRYKYFFNPVPNAVDQNRGYLAMLNMAANKIRKEFGIAKPKVALVMEKALWTDALVKLAKKQFPELNLEIVGVWKPSPMATDMTAELTAIKAAGAQIIYEVFTGPAAVILNKQVGELQVPVTVLGLNMAGASMGKDYWDETNGMCAYETTMAADFSTVKVTEKSKPVYDKLFKKLGNKMPTLTGFAQYDNVYTLKEAIERAGTMKSDAVVAEMEKTNWIGSQGRVAFYPKTHHWPHAAIFGPGYFTFVGFQWRDGKMFGVWPDGVMPPLEKDPAWEGLRYEGIVDFQLPPRMTEYWKKKQ